METEIPSFKKPSRFSIFWFQNYFSDNPATVFREEEVYYDQTGYVRSRQSRSYNYWAVDTCCPAHHGPYSYWYCGGCDCNCNGSNDCGEAGGILAIIVLGLLALAAFFVACAIAFNYPPIMIISWTILVIGSFTQSIVGFAPECFGIRWYNGVSSIFVALIIIIVIGSVIRLQALYKHYYPGTPNVKVDVTGLLNLFRISRIFYLYFSILSTCLCIAGLYLSLTCVGTNEFAETRKCRHVDACLWTSVTMYCWVFIHALNIVASIAMYKRMQAKHKVLKDPPAYAPVEIQEEDFRMLEMDVNRDKKKGDEPLPSYTL